MCHVSLFLVLMWKNKKEEITCVYLAFKFQFYIPISNDEITRFSIQMSLGCVMISLFASNSFHNTDMMKDVAKTLGLPERISL